VKKVKEEVEININGKKMSGAYTGSAKNGKRQGNGILELVNDDVFEGDWD